MQEYDRRTDDDSPEDIVDIPGISIDTGADLSDQQAHRVQERVQKQLGDLS